MENSGNDIRKKIIVYAEDFLNSGKLQKYIYQFKPMGFKMQILLKLKCAILLFRRGSWLLSLIFCVCRCY